MAGSYKHMTNDDGTPCDERFGVGTMLENDGDVDEALRECYGMIWLLAARLAEFQAHGEPSRAQIMANITSAWINSNVGLTRGISGQ